MVTKKVIKLQNNETLEGFWEEYMNQICMLHLS